MGPSRGGSLRPCEDDMRGPEERSPMKLPCTNSYMGFGVMCSAVYLVNGGTATI